MHGARIVDLSVGDRHHHGLHGCEPYRECSRVVLNQNAEEALDRTVESAMAHERLVLVSIFADILEAEAARQGEIELHGGELPLAADGVHQFHVDLRAVESG